MSLPRRFLNLIVENGADPGIRSLSCIDLTRYPLFHPPLPTATTMEACSSSSIISQQQQTADAFNTKNKHADGAAFMVQEKFQLPDPIFSFKAQAADPDYGWNIDCFPLADRKVVCVDQSGRAFLFDADTDQVVTMPSLNKPKWRPFSLFVPGTDNDGGDGEGSSLYIMEKSPKSEAGCSARCSDQFEAFVYRKPTVTASFMSWYCQLLPPLPYVRDYAYSQRRHRITSYAVVAGDDDGSRRILVSAEDAGTYCLDVASNMWSRVGEWTLPFLGKVEYVPELKLWFGLSAEDQLLAAADLAAMDSQPELVSSWKELEQNRLWQVTQDPQLVNLGSGICIARFIEKLELGGDFDNKLTWQDFVILTGVEVTKVVNHGNCSGNRNGRVELQMTTHKSRFHLANGAYIDAVF